MKKNLIVITILTLFSFSQEQDGCDERAVPYWWNGINSRIEGEGPMLRYAFKEIRLLENNIKPANGFITLRLYISKEGKFCDIESFQIDEDYRNTEFNNGELIRKLEQVAVGLKDWKRDKDFKTYNLIRIKIKNGQIEEVY